MTAPPSSAPDGPRALAIAIAWMLVAQVVCVLAWDAGWLTRAGALGHWLVVGVLPPALALWRSGRVPAGSG